MFLTFIGVVLVEAGGIIIYLSCIGKIFSYMTKEATPGAEKITHAVGRGIASGIKKDRKKSKNNILHPKI